MLNFKKTLAFFVVLLVTFIGLLYIWEWLSIATIKVSVPEDARIYIVEADGTYKRLGTGRVTYKTRSTDTVLFEARKDKSVTQKGIQPKRRTTTEVTMRLKDPLATEVAAPGPFIYPLIEGEYIYGINANTRSLDVKHLSDQAADKPRLPLLPFLKQVVWRDSKNYIYVTAAKGTGVVSTSPSVSVNGLPYIAAAAPNAEVTALLSGDGLSLAKGLDIKNASRVADSKPNTTSFLFADDNYIYFGWTEFELAHEDEGGGGFSLNRPPEEEEHDPDILGVTLQIFSHPGQKVQDFELSLKEQVFRITSVDRSTVAILATDGVHFLNIQSEEVKKVKFSFGEVVDMVLFKNRLLLLGSAGLWEYDINQDESYRLATYPGGEEYVPNSLTVMDGALFFSSNTSKEELKKDTTTARSRVYRINLN